MQQYFVSRPQGFEQGIHTLYVHYQLAGLAMVIALHCVPDLGYHTLLVLCLKQDLPCMQKNHIMEAVPSMVTMCQICTLSWKCCLTLNVMAAHLPSTHRRPVAACALASSFGRYTK